MSKIDIPYLIRIRARGRDYYYYRRGTYRKRINAQPASPEFASQYEEIHGQFERTPAGKIGDFPAASIGNLIIAYKASPEFAQLTPRTQTDYRRYLDKISQDLGNLPARGMKRRHVLAYRDRFGQTPRTANYIIQILRLIMEWGLDRGWIDTNPARRPRQLKTGPGHRPWEEFEIAAFRAHWPIGTVERVAFEILLNTGQRGGDVVAMTRHQAAHGQIAVAQEKTGERVWIPQTDDLRPILDQWCRTSSDIMILTTAKGRPFTVDNFRHRMRAAIRAAQLPDDCSIHGLRYTAATILREIGCDMPTIQAITGHRTAEMARKYSEKKRRAKIAIAKLNRARRDGHSGNKK